MPLQARRVFRLSLTVALSLVFAYTLPMTLPYLAPVFAVMLGATPGPPMRLKGLVGLTVLAALTTGIGILLIPLLLYYPMSALLVVTLGLYFSFYLTVHLGKGLVGAFLTVGITLVSAAGTVSDTLAISVIQDLLLGIVVAILCQWLAYPWFPEDGVADKAAPEVAQSAEQSTWIALRGTLIVLPTYLVALIHPMFYLPIIMKSVALGQQASVMDARHAGRELLGSTFLAGCLAVGFWALLKLAPNLWTYGWLMLLLMVFVAARLYRIVASRYPATFWINAVTTMLILIGPAVQDSANGKDVKTAFAVRLGLYLAVTLYAWFAVAMLEQWRRRRIDRTRPDSPIMEVS